MSKKDKSDKVLKPVIPYDKELHKQGKICAVTHSVNLSDLAEGMMVDCLQRIALGKTTAFKLSEKAPSKSKS